MDNVGGMQSFEGAECLIDEVLGVVVGQVLRADDAVHVGLHQLLDHYGTQRARRGQYTLLRGTRTGEVPVSRQRVPRTVDFLELLYRWRLDDV